MSDCVALTTRVLFPSIRDDKYPKWVREAKSSACRHTRLSLYQLPESPTTRNEWLMLCVWRLHLYLDDLDRFDRNYRAWKYTSEKKWKPVNSKKVLMSNLMRAWDAYKEWDYGY